MGFLAKLLRRGDSARTDALRLYSTAMTQARQPEFYGEGRVADNYDGRIDVLTLHLALIIRALNTHGEQGKRLAQAIYEVMRDDWDVALREEGMSDTGVMKRIKPMIRLFYTRLKAYSDGIEAGSIEEALHHGVLAPPIPEPDAETNDEPKTLADMPYSAFVALLSAYTMEMAKNLAGKSLGELALGQFEMATPPNV